MSDARRFFPGIHALRAIAATLVVVAHAASISKDYSWIDFTHPYFYHGRMGVILFFAISGFVIALQRTKPVGLFVAHRLLRIYPTYWLALVVAAVAFRVAGLPVGAGPAAILLYPANTSQGGMWIPYWSLAFEMVFYALAAIAFGYRLSDRALTILAVAWIVAVNLFASNPKDANEYTCPGAWILLSSVVQVLPMGLLCGIHFERLRSIGRSPYLAGMALAFIASLPLEELSVPKLFVFGVSACCLIVAVADIDLRSRVVNMLGDASYGIYLMHFPPIIIAQAVAPSLGFIGFLIIGMASGIMFGMLDHAMYRRILATLPRWRTPFWL
jgi:exopolysaccharide production protein ExoZ